MVIWQCRMRNVLAILLVLEEAPFPYVQLRKSDTGAKNFEENSKTVCETPSSMLDFVSEQSEP